MGARKQREPSLSRAVMFVKGRRFDRNPLRRATDRVETAMLALLVIAFLAATPFAALLTGAWVHGMARSMQVAQQHSRWPVTALALAVTPPSAGWDRLDWEAQARWRAPDGRLVTTEIPVSSGTSVGEKLPIWTDRTGDFTLAPLTDSQVSEQTASGEVLGVIITATVLAIVGARALWALGRRRMADWATDWAATEPRWTART
jgi:hypothetical protein